MALPFAFAIFTASAQPAEHQTFAEQHREFERRRLELRERLRDLDARALSRSRSGGRTISPGEQATLDKEREAIHAEMQKLREEELAGRDELRRARAPRHAEIRQKRRTLLDEERALQQRRRAIIARRRELADQGEGPDSKEMQDLKEEEAAIRQQTEAIRTDYRRLQKEDTARSTAGARPGGKGSGRARAVPGPG